MKVVAPIKEKYWQEEFADYLQSTNQRNYVLYMCGIYLGLRISDILSLRVMDFKSDKLTISEQKTNKTRSIFINKKLRKALDEYTRDMKNTDLLFPSRKKTKTGKKKALTRKGAIDILKDAAREVGYDEPIGTHSLRKTFAYNYYDNKPERLPELQRLLGHAKQLDTLRYLGLDQELFDSRIANM